MRINLGDARDKLSELVKAAEDGQRVTICRHGEPVVDLVRTMHRDCEPPKFGTLAGKGIVIDPDWHRGPESDAELDAWLKGQFE